MSNAKGQNMTEERGYITEGSGTNVDISLSDSEEETEIIAENNEVTLVLPHAWRNKVFLIGFQGKLYSLFLPNIFIINTECM